uniref:ADAMTS cysteine-rich domain-containing protein n=1 Tax=Romanomermis culicivorax TaxID=13658 RepID=A0A915JPS5_ROMCU
ALKDETECLRHSPLQKTGYFGLVEQQSLYPGQKVDADKQCQHAFGKNYRFCDKDGSFAKEMCKQLWCKNANSNSKDKHCSTKSYLPALT